MSLDEIQCLDAHTDRVWHVAWSPDGRTLASCSGDKTVRLWECGEAASGWSCKVVLECTHTKTIRSVNWSPGGASLATASFDGATAIWAKAGARWEQVAILEGHENEVKCAVFSPSGSLLATCGRDKTVWIWESFPGNDFECVDVKQGHSQDVKKVAWHPNSELLASASYDNTIKLWREDKDGGEWYCAQTMEGVALGHDSTVWDLAFDTSGERLASVSDDGTLKVWDAHLQDSGEPHFKLLATLQGDHTRSVYALSWSSQGAIATACGDNGIRVFDSAAGAWQLQATVAEAHSQDVNCVAWSPTDPLLLTSCSDDGCIKLWRYAEAAASNAGV